MKKIKVMFYINGIYGGGAERVMTNLASSFAISGNDVILVTSFYRENEYELNPYVKRISLEETEIKESWIKRNVSRVLKLRKLCKKEKPDVLISFMAEPNYRALVSTIGLPVKNIISVRNDPDYEYGGCIGKFLGKYLLPIADGCVFQTEDARKWFPEKLQRKSKIIFNMVKEDFYQTTYSPLQEHIVACGRLEKQKNFDLLIEAFTVVVKKYPKATLHIYGEGSLKEELQEKIKKNGMDKKIRLMGATQDIPQVLSEAAVFILSSILEGMPNALMEAMAVGVPCISTDCPCGGPKVLIEPGKNGILVKNNDLAEMINAIELMLQNPDEAYLMGQRAKERANMFKGQFIIQAWQEYMEKTIQRT